MIRHLKNTEIDKNAWDHLIQQSPHGRPYAYAGYLDIVAPGWEALVVDDFSLVMPLPVKQRMGLRYMAQPPWCQQLGLFGKSEFTGENLLEFIEKSRKLFPYIEISMHGRNYPPSALMAAKERTNFILPLAREYKEILAGYNENTRRNLKKSKEEGIRCGLSQNPEELLSMKWKHKHGNLQKKHIQTAANILQYGLSQNRGEIRMAYLEGEAVAGVFFLKDAKRSIYLISASSEKGKESGAMFRLVDTYIQEYAGTHRILDFEGSEIPGIARFFKGFGATNEPYTRITINQLPGWIKLLTGKK